MKKITSFLALMCIATALMAQDTVITIVRFHTTTVHTITIDTMAAKPVTDKMALDVHGDVYSVLSRTYDYANNTVVEETRVLDDQGSCISATRKTGTLNRQAYASLKADILAATPVEYTNVITMNNSYKNGKIYHVEVQDMERGNYEITYRYDLCGNVIGHDTLYDGLHHLDYTARYDRYHNPTLIRESTGSDDDNEITIRYKYAHEVPDKMLQKTEECYNYANRTSKLSTTDYHYDDNNRVVREVTNSDIDSVETTYTYDTQGRVVRKETQRGDSAMEETIQRDANGSCLRKKVVKDGQVVREVINEVTYGNGSIPSLS